MASLREIRRRINSVKSTQKITRAMKMVAAARLRRAQDAIMRARPYAFEMKALVDSLARRADQDAHPLLRPSKGGKIGLIVITSDRGLCGGFNSNIANFAMRSLSKQFEGRDVELTLVGRKGIELLKRRQCNIVARHTDVYSKKPMRAAAAVLDDAVDQFMAGSLDEIYCVYNEFKSAVQQTVTLERLLPFSKEGTGEGDAKSLDYLYEPSQEQVFESLLVKHLHVQMHRMLFESAASEHGARMTAMDSATRNAGEVIDRLTLQYNRARQDDITKQLIEVISGAEAL